MSAILDTYIDEQDLIDLVPAVVLEPASIKNPKLLHNIIQARTNQLDSLLGFRGYTTYSNNQRLILKVLNRETALIDLLFTRAPRLENQNEYIAERFKDRGLLNFHRFAKGRFNSAWNSNLPTESLITGTDALSYCYYYYKFNLNDKDKPTRTTIDELCQEYSALVYAAADLKGYTKVYPFTDKQKSTLGDIVARYVSTFALLIKTEEKNPLIDRNVNATWDLAEESMLDLFNNRHQALFQVK